MISAKNLVLNLSTKIDATANDEDHGKFDLKLDQNDNKETQDAQNAVDPSAFVALFGQVLTTMTPVQQEELTQVQSDANSEVAIDLQQQSNDLIDTALINSAESELFSTSTDESVVAALDATKVAMDMNAAQITPLATTVVAGASDQAASILKCLVTTPQQIPQEEQVDFVQSQATTGEDDTSAGADNPIASILEQSLLTGVTKTDTQNSLVAFDDQLSANNQVVPAGNMPSGYQPQTTHEAVKTISIPVQVTDPSWGENFSEHIVWLGTQEIKSAVLRVHPEELGPLEISVKVVKDNASVSILGHNADVKNIVDQAIPKLRDMMAEQGLNLTNVHIDFDQKSRQFSQNQNRDEGAFNHEGLENNEPELVTPLKRPPKGLIDYFA
jgi:flagellar hook-length control protein FliK